MRLTLRQLTIFAAIADTGSTAAAAERIPLSQSATSAALGELEKLFRQPLFDRVGKRLLINDAGRALLPRVRAALDVAEGIEREFVMPAEGFTGRRPPASLRLAASTTIGNYLLPGLIATFRRQWADARINLQIANTREVSSLVRRLEVDMGLIEGASHEPELRQEAWLQDELGVVAAPTHPLASRRFGVLDFDALRQAQWLLREPGSGTREAVEAALLPHLNQLREPVQLGSTEAIKQAVVAGMGLTCLSSYATRDLIAHGQLKVLPTALPRLTRRFYLIYHEQKQFSAALAAFREHCRKARLRPPAG
jgi:DNA-binding transcriptional LysR family regulator